MHLNALDIVVIVLYMTMMSLIGVYFSRRQTSRSEFFLGGRSMHWILVGGSLSLFSTISFMSVPGEMISYGVGLFVAYLILPVVIPVTNRIVLPVLMRLPITSAYEYLNRRFGKRVNRVSAYVFVFKTLLWMGAIIYSASLAISEVTGWSIFFIITVIGLITTFYTSAGGLRTVVWTDFIQTLLFTACALVIPIFIGIVMGKGPISWWETFSQAGRTEIQTFSLDPTVRITTVGNTLSVFFWFICTNASDQMIVQRYLSTPSIKTARRSLWVFALSTAISIFFLMVCGLALFAYYAERSGLPLQEFQQQVVVRADRVMPRFIAQELPHGISGLIVAGLLAAAMSGLSSGMNAIASVIIEDFAPRLSGFRIFKQPLILERMVGITMGIIGIGLAVAITITMRHGDLNLAELSGRLNHVLIGPLAVLFFSGILLRRAAAGSVLVGLISSTLVSMLISFGHSILGFEQRISFTWMLPCSVVMGLVTTAAASYLFKPPSDLAIANLTLRRESSG